MSDRVWQEFYCNDCDGYIRVKLNMAINHAVKVKCPNCGREHPRGIKDGQIVDDYRREGAEVITPTASAYSKEPFTKHILKHARDGAVIENKDQINKQHPASDQMIKQRWFEIFGGN